MSERPAEAEIRAALAAETASRELLLVALELRRIAEHERPRSKYRALHLESIATRLESVAAMLGCEVGLGVDAPTARSLGSMARRLLAMAAAALAFVAGGVMEGVGGEVYSRLIDDSASVTKALTELESAVENLAQVAPEDLDAQDAAVPDSTVLPGYSGKTAAAIVGISYGQLDYWVRTDLIGPSLTDPGSGGGRRRYSYRDLLDLKLVKTLLDGGVPLDTIRDGLGDLRNELGDDMSTAKLVVTDSGMVLVRENEDLVEVVNRYQGQGVLNLAALDRVQQQVDDAIGDLFPDVP